MNVYRLCIGVLFLISCQTEDGKTTDKLNTDVRQDSAIVAGIRTEDSIKKAVIALGNYSLIATEEFKKCNLIKGFYSLNGNSADSADLAMLAKYLAFELFKEKRPEANCEYRIMSQVFIYPDSSTYEKYADDYLAMCTTDQNKLAGDVLVNDYKLKKGNGKSEGK